MADRASLLYQRTIELEQHGAVLRSVLEQLQAQPYLTEGYLMKLLRRYPLPDGRFLSKSQLLDGYLRLCDEEQSSPDPALIRFLQLKPTRTISGVAPVSVLTEPFPCPGTCIFCPHVEGMPASYLPDEPGAMRAASHRFDPYDQTAGRIAVMEALGHAVDKVELLILGGTWSYYPPEYQEWFIRRCLDALNKVDSPTLDEAQRLNETAPHRNVGLVIETRPDFITPGEVLRLRRLGVTKVQLGV